MGDDNFFGQLKKLKKKMETNYANAGTDASGRPYQDSREKSQAEIDAEAARRKREASKRRAAY